MVFRHFLLRYWQFTAGRECEYVSNLFCSEYVLDDYPNVLVMRGLSRLHEGHYVMLAILEPYCLLGTYVSDRPQVHHVIALCPFAR